MSPSVAALPLFLAARAWPLSLRTFLAPSTSPADSSSARFTSIIPAAVSSRRRLIFSIVLAKVTASPHSLRSPRPAPPLRQARPLLPQAFPPQAPRRLQAPQPQDRRSQSRRPRLRPPAPPRPRSRPQPLLQVWLPVLPELLARPLVARHWSRWASRWDPPPSAEPRRSPESL